MKIAAHGIEWNYEWRGRKSPPVLALLHGFAGSRHGFDGLVPHSEEHFRLLLLDLPGHGETRVPARAMTVKELGGVAGEVLRELAGGPVILCGYSMGGRVALHTGLFSPSSVSALILIGASCGIEDARERERRRASDHALADQIVKNGIAWFADYWAALPLFASQKNLPLETQAKLRAGRLACNPEGLAYSLRNFGTGEQVFLGKELHRLACPILLLAGERDEKFSRLNHYIAAAVGRDTVRVAEIAGAGHATHIENPYAVAHEILSFVQTIGIET